MNEQQTSELTEPEIALHLEILGITFRYGFEWCQQYITVKPLRYPKNINRVPFIAIFTQPIEFCSIKYKDIGTLRLLSTSPRYGITENGTVYDVVDDRLIKPATRKPISVSGDYSHYPGEYVAYPTTRIYDPEKHMNVERTIHRLIAIAWCENDDYYTKWVVDHIDSDKSNHIASNLRWLSASMNTARSDLGYDERWLVKEVGKKAIYKFASLKELAKFIDLDFRYISYRKFPFIHEVGGRKYIIEDQHNFRNWVLELDIVSYGMHYLLIRYGKRYYFRTGAEVRDFLGIKGNLSIEDIKKAAKGYRFITLIEPQRTGRATDLVAYTAKSLTTGKILTGRTHKELAEKLGVTKSMVTFRLSKGNTGHKVISQWGIPVDSLGDRWILKSNKDKEYPEVRERRVTKKVLGVYNKATKVRTSVQSLRNLADNYQLSRHVVSSSIKKYGEYEDTQFIIKLK